jgi:protoporphyrinogen/coproporphyrinogen III oxidase
MTRVAIVGGGISGLAAAFALEQRRQRGDDIDYTLYEFSPRLGGVLRTETIDGCIVEAGPDSFLSEKPWASDLCREVGLGDQLIGSNDKDRKTYILVRGRLVEMPDGLMFMVPTKIVPMSTSPLFSWNTKLRMMQEFFHPPRAADHDESVAAFVERHYGNEMVDRLADPLLSGIYGGEAANLSVRAVLPRFVEMEKTYGSLGRGMIAAQKNSIRAQTAAKPIFTSLKNGMQSFADAVAARLEPSSFVMNAPVQAIQREGDDWVISAGLQSDGFDAVVVALPTHAAADALRMASAELSTELSGISYTSSITVGLGYDGAVRESLPPGFGFLVPRSEGKTLLAATFVHNKFPQRAAENRALLRCFFGGANAEKISTMADEQIVELARNELLQILGLRAAPLFARVYRWKSAMAQYAVGHLERLERIERLRKQMPGLGLAGNGYRGIGIPDCVRSGQEAVEQALSENHRG